IFLIVAAWPATSVVAVADPNGEAQWFMKLLQTYNKKSFCLSETASAIEVAKAVQQYALLQSGSDTLTTAQVIQVLATLYPCPRPSIGKTVEVPAKGEYATIETKRWIEIARTFRSTLGHENDSLLDDVKKHSDAYQPPVFLAMAELLYRRGDVEEAIFW